jgi:hypothetical protein
MASTVSSMTQLVDANLLSQKTAIQKIFGINAQEADIEIAEIQKTQQISQAS